MSENVRFEEFEVTGEKLIATEMAQIKEKMPEFYEQFVSFYQKTEAGDRDLYF